MPQGDALPTADDFAGWPPLGACRRVTAVGPVVVTHERLDARALAALEALPSAPDPSVGEALPVTLSWTRASRPPWLALAPGDIARSTTWLLSGAPAWATHHVALLMDSRAERGIVVMTDQRADDVPLAVQNVLRVVTAWRMASSRRGLLVHASAVRHARGAVVLLGPSGAGKSTAARLSAPREVLADDCALLMAEASGGRFAPTPLWAEPALAGRSEAALPLAIVLRLRQETTHALRPCGAATAAAALLAHAPFLGEAFLGHGSDMARHVASLVPGAELGFRPDDGFWRLIDDSLQHAARSGVES